MPLRLTVSTISLISVVLLAPVTPAAEKHAENALFTPVSRSVESNPREPREEVDRFLDGGLIDPGVHRYQFGVEKPANVGRSREVRVDVDQLASVRAELTQARQPQHLNLNLFADLELTAVMHRTERTKHGFAVSGHIEGDSHGSVTLVVVDNIVAAAIHSREGNFLISATNGVIHTVREVEEDWACGVDHDEARLGIDVDDGRSQLKSVQHSTSSLANEMDDGSTIDILVLFTQAALEVAGSLRAMQASIDLDVAWTNDAYDASGVEFQLNLVAAMPIDYAESTLHGGAGLWNQRVDKDRLIDPSDGFMDEAHALRDRYAADIVHLFVDQSGGGGIGEILRPSAEDPSAWAVSVSNVGDPGLFAHELGHVMGLLHDRYAQRGQSRELHSYARGYVNQRMFDDGASAESRWRTIMAYDSQCRDEGVGCAGIPRFSNPNQNCREQFIRQHPSRTRKTPAASYTQS